MSSPSAPESPPSGSHYQPRLSVVLVLLILFIGATFVILRAAPMSTSGATTTTSTTLAGSHPTTTTTLPPRSRVRVQVANGTLTTGLARSYTQLLITQGWDTLPQVNAARAAKTIVYFNPGFQWAAQQIAAQIKVAKSAVTPLSGLSPVPGASGDDVIVILGPDVAVS